jgi:nucleotide-binding universal stress UspA family protein
MTAIETLPLGSFNRDSKAVEKRPTVIVATDGSDDSNAAFTAAWLLAQAHDLELRVVSVLEPMVMPVRIPGAFVDAFEIDTLRGRDLATRAQTQMKAATKSAEWPVETRIGRPAETIGQIANEYDASLIVTGPSKHGFFERIVGGETAARVAQLTRVPLLAASPDMDRLPQRIVVAMDLDPLHLAELSLVLKMFGPAASVVCVHVQPREEFPGADSPAFTRAYETAVNQSFEATANAISKVQGMRADLIRLNGDPAAELLRYAEYAKTELLVLGLRRHYGLRRFLGGGVALKVLRGATSSVLIVPERAAPTAQNGAERRGKRNTTLTSYDPTTWLAELKRFTEFRCSRRQTARTAFSVSHTRADRRWSRSRSAPLDRASEQRTWSL